MPSASGPGKGAGPRSHGSPNIEATGASCPAGAPPYRVLRTIGLPVSATSLTVVVGTAAGVAGRSAYDRSRIIAIAKPSATALPRPYPADAPERLCTRSPGRIATLKPNRMSLFAAVRAPETRTCRMKTAIRTVPAIPRLLRTAYTQLDARVEPRPIPTRLDWRKA